MSDAPGQIPLLDVNPFEYLDEIGHEYTCRIRVFRAEAEVIILATEYTRDEVPAAMRQHSHEIATDFRRTHALAELPFTWIEHYDDRASHIASTIGGPDRDNGEAFYLASFAEHGTRLSRPSRISIPKSNVESLVGTSLP